MNNLWPTVVEAIGGFLIGNLFAIALATAFVHRKAISETFFALVVLINSIPVVAKAPILVLLLGNGFAPKIAIAAVISFFPTLVNMVRGLESVNPQAMELMRVLSASEREVFVKLRVYNSLPYLFSALRISASSSVIGAIVGEWIGSNYGIGALIIQATYAFDSASALRRGVRRLSVLGPILSDDLACRTADRPLAAAVRRLSTTFLRVCCRRTHGHAGDDCGSSRRGPHSVSLGCRGGWRWPGGICRRHRGTA